MKKKLPTPRLQLRWEPSTRLGYEWQCHYELVILLNEFDVRREVYRNGMPYKKKLPRELAIPMKPPTMRNSSSDTPPCGAEPTRYADEPFRDGAHARWDAIQLGDLPIFVIAPDGKSFPVKYDPVKLRADRAQMNIRSKKRPFLGNANREEQMTEPSDLELAERLEQIAVAITNRDNSELTMSIPPRPERDYDIVLQFAAARLRQRSEDAERYRYWREYALDEESDMGLSEALALSETSQEFDAILDKERAARKARLVDIVERRRKLLERVLQCGLCEEPHGVGFTPSRQERIASDLARDIGNELRGIDALVKG